ncbi:nitroreductase [Streptomyces sp. Rer75]|uniref:nitroreductase family protein n=1 Tax=unclassified Streptomyces TaxID=2593676 RepID=UPI0015D032C0|nr:nitroreductase [Streptomyces sp. Rer75]QLH24737.1 nitroreductase [Streptomyces sp. Rer75]
MDVMTAILTRRSEQKLAGPAPSPEEFRYLLKAASCAPDHGMLRPWRWLLMSGDARDALAAALAEDNGKSIEAMRAKTRRAPLLATLVFSPDPVSPVPEWEQMAAVSAMTTSLMLLLHARGFGSIWRTGAQLDAEPVRKLLDLDQPERALGWLYIGTVEPGRPTRRRETPDVGDRLKIFSPSL